MIGSINRYSTIVAPPAHPIFPRSNLALLQTVRNGRAISLLLSSLSGPSDSFLPAPSRLAFAPQTQSSLQRPSLALLLARSEGAIGASQLGQPSIADSRIAHKAYLAEIQTKNQIEQAPRGSNWMNGWSA